jgi:deoxyribodipyrimidine photo-lyase
VDVDPQPFFRRIYNAAHHMELFDPQGDCVRRYVPELATVPAPIVDHSRAREEAFERYRV